MNYSYGPYSDGRVRQWVPNGATVSTVAEGDLVPGSFGFGSYVGEFSMEFRIDTLGGTVGGGLFVGSAGGDGGAPRHFGPYSSVSWTNTTGTSQYVVMYFEPSHMLAESAQWSLDFTVSVPGIGGVLCLPLEASELYGPSGSFKWQCPCRATTDDSIDTWSGNEHMPLPGIEAGGRGPGLSFDVAYNSGASGTNSTVGYGWSSTYDMSLVLNPDGTRTVRQETGATVQFLFDGAGWVAPPRQSATLSQSGGVWTFTRNSLEIFEFDAAGRLSKLKDRNGYSATIVRDGSNRVDYVEHSDGRRLDFTYATNQITITDPLTPTPRSVVFTLDGSGDLISYTDVNGGVYAMTYSSHKLLTVRRPRHANAASPQPVFELHYDAVGRADWEEDELNQRTSLYYNDPVAGATRRVAPDGDQRVDYYTDGLLTTTTFAYGTSDAYSVARTYDRSTFAPLTETTDPGGLNLTVTYEYDSRGNRTKSTDPEGRVTSATYNAFDQPITVTDARSVVTTNTYDANGNLELVQTASTDPAGVRTIDPVYDVAHPGDVTSLTDARGKVWAYEYDTYGFLKTKKTPAPALDTTTMVNNPIGWVTSTVAPKGNATGGVPANYTTSFTYNGYGEVKNTSGPAGLVQRDYYLGGLLKQVTDQSSQVTTYAYDNAHQLITETRPGASILRTEYALDGAMSAQVDAAGARTEYTYDPAGRLKTVKDPLLRVTTFSYDKGSRLVSKQQPGGNCITPTACIKFEYFNDGQLKKVDYSDTTPDVAYTYEPTGRPATMSDGAALPATWDWDDLGRLKSYTDVTGAVSYGYDGLSGLVNRITYPGNKVLNRTFDNAGRMDQVTDWASRATSFDFDPNGNPDLTTFPAATTNSDDYTYDTADRMTGVSFNKTGSSPLGQLTFSRSHPEGFVSASSGSGVPNATETYGYSSLDQLDSLNANPLSYDSADNLTGFPAGPKQKFDAANQICYQATTNTAACGSAPSGATTYGYDSRGNRTSATTTGQTPRTMIYDQADRLITTKKNSGGLTTIPAGLVLDTRAGSRSGTCTASCATFTGPEAKTVQVTGVGGVPTTGVGAVMLDVTSTGGTTPGWVNVNRVPGWEAAAGFVAIDPGQANNVSVIAKVDGLGRITIDADHAVDVVITVSAWYATSDGTSGSTFTALPAARIVDTRTAVGACTPSPCARLAAGATTRMKVTGVAGVPTTDVTAVFVSVFAPNPAASGVVRVNPVETKADATINLDGTTPNAGTAIAAVAADGTIGVYSSVATDIVVDISGWFGATAAAEFVPVTPATVVYTAFGLGSCTPSPCGLIPANTTMSFQVTGSGGLPTTGMTAVVLNVTATSTGIGTARVNWNPYTNVSNTTFNVNGTGPNDSAVVIVIPDANGKVSLSTFSAPFDIIVDAVGYFTIPQTTTYTYSGDGLRRTKTSPDGTITTYTWDHNQSLPVLLKENIDAPGGTTGDKSIRYIYGPDGHVTEDITTVGFYDVGPRFYHHDQLGSTRMLTSLTGTSIGTAGYTPHGQTAATTGETTNIGWAGEYRDQETGYIYLRARYYDPATGQFLTRDPIEAITRSPYAYVQNNPINGTDPTGLDTCGRPKGVLGLFGSLVDCVANPTDLVDANVETAEQVVDTVKEHPGASATVAAFAWCLIPGVGWGSCAWAQGGALGVRSAEAARDDGWDAAGGIGLDALATYLTAGLMGWAFDDIGTYLGRLFPAGYDLTLFWEECFGE